MRTRLTLQPHQRGAKQRLAKYGDRLLCVRYRYDPQQKKRLKTVELIVEERPWDPGVVPQLDGRLVYLQVAASELAIRRQVKGAGGKWHPRMGYGRYPMSRWWPYPWRKELFLVTEAYRCRCLPTVGRHLRIETSSASISSCGHLLIETCIYE